MSQKDKTHPPYQNKSNNRDYSYDNSGYGNNQPRRNHYNNSGYAPNMNTHAGYMAGSIPPGMNPAHANMYVPMGGYYPPEAYQGQVPTQPPQGFVGFPAMPMKQYTEANLNAGMKNPSLGPHASLSTNSDNSVSTTSSIDSKNTSKQKTHPGNTPVASVSSVSSSLAAMSISTTAPAPTFQAPAPTFQAPAPTFQAPAPTFQAPVSSPTSGINGANPQPSQTTEAPLTPAASTQAPAAESPFGKTYLIISSSQVKYKGTLAALDREKMTMTFKMVQTLGTEDRVPVNSPQYVPSSNDIYEFKIFRKADIKKMIVSAAPVESPQDSFHDPAIISSGAIVGNTEKPQSQQQSLSQSSKKEDPEFDFNASNLRFNKDEDRRKALERATNSGEAAKYDKSKSFFDDLGSQLGKSKRNDIDTFGLESTGQSFRKFDGQNYQRKYGDNSHPKRTGTADRSSFGQGSRRPTSNQNTGSEYRPQSNQKKQEKKDHSYTNRKSQFD